MVLDSPVFIMMLLVSSGVKDEGANGDFSHTHRLKARCSEGRELHSADLSPFVEDEFAAEDSRVYCSVLMKDLIA